MLHRHQVIPVVLLAAVLAAPAAASAQVDERTLYVSVIDEAGAPVTDVSPADLVVKEDGLTREVLRVAPATTPLQVAVLVDNSIAARDDIANLRDGLKSFVATLAGKHELSLVAIADRPTLLVDSTSDLKALERGIGRIFAQPESGTYLLDALVDTTKGFKKREASRPVIVAVLIEAAREFSNPSPERVIDDLKSSYARFEAMVVTSPGSASMSMSTREGRDRAQVLDRGPSSTGGRRQDLLSSMGLSDRLKLLAAQLDQQVEVVYARPKTLIPPSAVTVSSTRAGTTASGVAGRPKAQARP